METLHNYFIYNKDYPRMNSIFKDLSSKLEAIHDKNMIVSNLTSNGIIHDDNDSFFFETVVPSNNFALRGILIAPINIPNVAPKP